MQCPFGDTMCDDFRRILTSTIADVTANRVNCSTHVRKCSTVCTSCTDILITYQLSLIRPPVLIAIPRDFFGLARRISNGIMRTMARPLSSGPLEVIVSDRDISLWRQQCCCSDCAKYLLELGVGLLLRSARPRLQIISSSLSQSNRGLQQRRAYRTRISPPCLQYTHLCSKSVYSTRLCTCTCGAHI